MKKYELTIIERLMRNGTNKAETFFHNHKVKINGETYNCFLNDHYIMCSAYDDFDFTEMNDAGTNKCLNDNLKPFENGINDLKEIDLACVKDDIEETKKYNRKNHSHNAYDYCLESGRHIGFNPAYMMDFIKYFKANHCFYINDDNAFTKQGSYKKPLYFENKEEKKIGILLPVNLDYYYERIAA